MKRKAPAVLRLYGGGYESLRRELWDNEFLMVHPFHRLFRISEYTIYMGKSQFTIIWYMPPLFQKELSCIAKYSPKGRKEVGKMYRPDYE